MNLLFFQGCNNEMRFPLYISQKDIELHLRFLSCVMFVYTFYAVGFKDAPLNWMLLMVSYSSGDDVPNEPFERTNGDFQLVPLATKTAGLRSLSIGTKVSSLLDRYSPPYEIIVCKIKVE